VAGPTGPKGAMRGGIRRQGDDTWQVRVYNSACEECGLDPATISWQARRCALLRNGRPPLRRSV
jgi:hypothetical protein